MKKKFINIYKNSLNIIYIRWLCFKRSILNRSKISGVIFDIFNFVYYLILAVVIGLHIEDILKISIQSTSPEVVIRQFLPPLIVISALARLVFKLNKKINLTNLLRYPISKNSLILNILAKKLLNKYTLSLILFLGSYCVKNLINSITIIYAVNFVTTHLYIIVYTELFNIVFHRFNKKKIILYIFLLLNILVTMPIIKSDMYIGTIISLLFIFINIYISFLILKDTLYINFNKSKDKFNYYTKIYQNEHLSIILKSILRNKVHRRFLSIYFVLFMGCGIYFTLNKYISIELSMFDLFLIMILGSGSLASNMIVTYIFSWDSNWKGFLFSKPIKIEQYVRSRILFAEVLAIVPSMWFFLLYVIFHHSMLLFLSAFCLFNLLLNVIQVYFSLYYYSDENPDILVVGTNQPGRFFLFPLLGVPILIIFIFNGSPIYTNELSLMPTYIISIFGIFTIILNSLWKRSLKKILLGSKYEILNS